MKAFLPLSFVFSVSLLVLPLWAVENLEDRCQDILSLPPRELQIGQNVRISLQADQILIRGHLDDFWEQGLEFYHPWGVLDEDHKKNVFLWPQDAQFILTEGDLVFILDSDGAVTTQGRYSERLNSTPSPSSPLSNLPVLLNSREGSKEILSTQDFLQLIREKRRVIVVKNVDPEKRGELRQRLLPQYRAYKKHLQNPARFVDIGSNTFYERAYYEAVLEGNLVVEEVFDGRFSPPDFLNLSLKTDHGVARLGYGHRLILVDQNNRQLIDLLLHSDNGYDLLADRKNPQGLLSLLPQASRAIVIGRKAP